MTIQTSPSGVGDVQRWSATKAAVAAGDLGMSTSTGLPSVYPAAAAAACDVPYVGQAPVWKKFTKTYSQLAAAATSNDVEVYSLAAGEVVHAVHVKHSASFTGGAVAAYTVSVGIAGTLNKYAAAFDVFQAVSNTAMQISTTQGVENWGAATSIRLAAVSTGANLDQATAGSVDVRILVSNPKLT